MLLLSFLASFFNYCKVLFISCHQSKGKRRRIKNKKGGIVTTIVATALARLSFWRHQDIERTLLKPKMSMDKVVFG